MTECGVMLAVLKLSHAVAWLTHTFNCGVRPGGDVNQWLTNQRGDHVMAKGILAFRQGANGSLSSASPAATGIYRFQGASGAPITIVTKPKPEQNAGHGNEKKGDAK
jgi:hypothetical protein